MYKKTTKIIASILVLMLTMTHFSMVGKVIAASLENQTQQTNHANVEFDTYFKEQNKKVHTTLSTIGAENYIYTSFQVKEAGYLKNIIMQAVDANFNLVGTENSQIAKIENNTVYFNQIRKGEPLEIAIPIQNTQKEQIQQDELNKESTIKLSATYVDGNGKEKQIEKEIKVYLAWTSQTQAELNMQIAKFIPYNVNGNKGLVLQTIVQSYLKDNLLPVQQNKIQITVPTLNNIKPQSIKVTANTTKATNGDAEGQNFSEENYTYNKETNQLTIAVQNQPNEQKVITWNKLAQDEFVITYFYGEEASNSITQEGVKVAIQANNELTTYEASQTKVTKEISGEVTLKDQVSTLVDFSLQTNVEQLSKGQLYANYNTTSKKETEYQEILVANISLAQLTDKIILESQVDQFVDQDNTKNQANATYNKTITISQAEVNKILGQEAQINFYVGNTLVANITKETTPNEQGNFVISLTDYNTSSLRIETSKPQTEGKLTFVITKAIKGEIGYSKKQVATFHKLEENLIGKAMNEEVNFVEQKVTKEIPLNETTSVAELVLDNSSLSTVVTNENVKLTAVLKTDTLQCSLYQNPTLQIILPNYIETINIKNIEVLFDTEGSKLTLQSYKVVPNADGTKTILVVLEGTQTEYTLSSMSKGVNVVVTADITLNKLTANKQDQLRMIYTNNNSISQARTVETNETFATINVVAPTGVVTTSSVSNYNEGAEEITAIAEEEKTAIIPTLAEARTATFTMSVINNYNSPIENISILGRIPAKGNLDSTINMALTQALNITGVDQSKVKIYYSEKADATKEVNAEENAWTLTPTNYEKVKSYLIVLENSMNTADTTTFSYSVQIPANLQHNEAAFENYEVYFDNHLEKGIVQDKQVATKLGLSTGKGPVLEANISTDTPKEEEKLTGSIIHYTVSVKNTGTESAQNVVANIELPTGLKYVALEEGSTTKYKTLTSQGQVAIELGNIQPNETVNKEVSMQVNVLPSNVETLISQVQAKITASNIDGTLETETIENTLARTHFIITPTVKTERKVLRENDEYTYYFEVVSSSIYEEQKDSILEITFPEEILYQKVEVHWKNSNTEISEDNIEYNKAERLLRIKLGDLDGRNPVAITLKVKVGTLPENVYDKQVNITAKVFGKEAREQYAVIDPVQIGKIGFKVIQSSNIPENSSITAGEDFKYIFTIENLSNIDLYDVKFTDLLPEELDFNSILATSQSGNKKSSYKESINLTIGAKETITVEVNVSAKLLEETKTIINKAKIEYEGINSIETSSYKHIIEKFDETNYPTDSTSPVNQTKRIMGTIWIDANKNGAREETEAKLPNVEVFLFNNTAGTLVTDNEGNIAKTTTDENGTYTFLNVSQGKYTVIFLYDSTKYSSTVYQMENVDATINSDGVDSQITFNGETKLAALTEEITVSDGNIYNIDLGLIENPKFDLKLDKMVSKITVQDANGTNVYEYNDSKVAKKELVGKQINNTTIIVEYKIRVTNEGAISGFVKKIADYMPSEMKFNSELNKDWYTSGNGILYNSSLTNTMINPGESKEVTLILTKKMTENNLGIYHNEAEIYEAYNDLGLEDMDSKVANKVSNEDDISSADVLISVKTGETILFIGLSISIIVSIGAGAYFIKRKILR